MEDKPQQSDIEGYILRLRFSRAEPAIWLAHLDLMRTFERAIRRADLPVAYSKGFNPRPQLAFALPIGVGLATNDDYVDVSLTRPIEPSRADVKPESVASSGHRDFGGPKRSKTRARA